MTAQMLQAIQKGTTYAIIPARSGSKGVKNKNIKLLCGYPLMAYSIAAATMSPSISRTIVSTDSADYAKLANKYGAETPFIRPAEISMDNSTDIEFMQHSINWLYQNEGQLPEFFVHLRPTTPLRRIADIEKALDIIKQSPQSTSMRSAHLASNTPYKWFKISKGGYFQSILGNITNDEANNPRQKFEDVFIPDGYVDILKTEFIIKNNLLHGQNMLPYVVSDNVDVDAPKDLDLLEFHVHKYHSEILEYLEKTFEKEI